MGLLLTFLFITGMSNSMENIFSLAENGNIEKLDRELISGANVNAKDKNGQTLLMYAAIGKQLEAVKMLKDKGADISAKDNYGFSVIDILESRIRRSGKSWSNTFDALKEQGFTDQQIENLKASSKPAGTEEDVRRWELILDFLNSKN